MDQNPNKESLLEFPCRFPIRAMGRAEPGFDSLVVEIVRRHVPDLREGAVISRPSSTPITTIGAATIPTCLICVQSNRLIDT